MRIVRWAKTVWARLSPRIKSLTNWWNHTRPGRAWNRYSGGQGSVLSGGIAYALLFALFSILVLVFSMVGIFLGADSQATTNLVKKLDDILPGLVGDKSAGISGLVDVSDLQTNLSFTWTSIVAIVVLIPAVLSYAGALQAGLRAMFGMIGKGPNYLVEKLRQLGGLLVMALSIVTSAALLLFGSGLLDWLTDLVGIQDSWFDSTLTKVITWVVAVLVDLITVLTAYVLLAGARFPWRDMLLGACGATVGIEAIRLIGGTFISASAERNAFLASFSVLVTVLLWANLLSRIMLMSAAWVANPKYRAREAVPEKQELAELQDRLKRSRLAEDSRRIRWRPTRAPRRKGHGGART